MYYENFNLTDVVTLVKIDKLDFLLWETGYNSNKRNYIIQGLREGFDIGYRGDTKIQRKAPNLKFRIGNEIILWNKVMKEVKLGRYTGPFQQVPLQVFLAITNPTGTEGWGEKIQD